MGFKNLVELSEREVLFSEGGEGDYRSPELIIARGMQIPNHPARYQNEERLDTMVDNPLVTLESFDEENPNNDVRFSSASSIKLRQN